MRFCRKMCNVVNTRFFRTISHVNENNDLGSSKALKWVRIFLERSFFYYNAFWPQVLKARFRFRTHWVIENNIMPVLWDASETIETSATYAALCAVCCGSILYKDGCHLSNSPSKFQFYLKMKIHNASQAVQK